jgi:serine/threonine protein kinase
MDEDVPTIELEDFVNAAVQSGLLTHDAVVASRAVDGLDGEFDASLLAERLVAAGALSRFQARQLLKGRTRGLVIGPFHVLAPLGRGGMSRVYLARDTRKQSLVALKVLPPAGRSRNDEPAEDRPRRVARFLREMDLSQRMAHRHIARTYEVGVWHGVYYIAMEYLPGRTLRRTVAGDGPLAVDRAARLFAEIADALAHAHAHGVIHRDLKPSNIMVTPGGRGKVLDFGLALLHGEANLDPRIVGGQGYVVGTMDYIAPEQSHDPTRVCPRSDLYALGCSLYFALSGRTPFPGGSSLQKILRHRSEEPALLESVAPTVPPAFARLVRRLMAKRPEDRPSSAEDVRAELLSWANRQARDEVPAGKPSDTAIIVREVEANHADEPDDLPSSDEWAIRDGDASDRQLWSAGETTQFSPSFMRQYGLPLVVGALAGLLMAAIFYVTRRAFGN